MKRNKVQYEDMGLYQTQNEQNVEKKEVTGAAKEPVKVATKRGKAKREPRPVQPTLFDNYEWPKQ
jgi:hypothetical protein